MAFKAKDGSPFTNHSDAKQHDTKLAARTPKQAPITPQSAPEQEPDGDEQQGDGMALAQQHGPAAQIDISHDHASGQHTVHVQHPDGHAHESQHSSAAEAHKFAGDCAGGGM